MDSVKTFFNGQHKDATLANNQRSLFSLIPGRSVQADTGNGLTNGAPGNGTAKITNYSDVKRKDRDNYFYIMWRS